MLGDAGRQVGLVSVPKLGGGSCWQPVTAAVPCTLANRDAVVLNVRLAGSTGWQYFGEFS